jgi:hypothetical protein
MGGFKHPIIDNTRLLKDQKIWNKDIFTHTIPSPEELQNRQQILMFRIYKFENPLRNSSKCIGTLHIEII